MHLRFLALSVFAAIGIVACGGGGSNGIVSLPTAAPTATPAPAVVATSVPFNGGAAQVAAPIAPTPLPAPTGYAQTISATIVTIPANTTVAVQAGASPPAAIPVLDKSRRVTKTLRPFVASPYNPIYYDVITPSNSVTVAGSVTNTVTFPANTLTSGTQYYLGFYDTTQSSPAWQTIDGPVTSSDGKTLSFSGTVPSFTFQANAAYAFVVFSTSSASITPPPVQTQDLAYLSQGTNGILVTDATGTSQHTLAITSTQVALDDAGNLYTTWATPPPAPSPGASPPAVTALLQEYASGATTPTRTYQLPASTGLPYIGASGAGEFFATSFSSPQTGGLQTTVNVWNPGVSGSPSYALSSFFNGPGEFFVEQGHDGTIILANTLSNGALEYSVYPPGSTTPSRTFGESIVSLANQAYFIPNYATIGPDGTLYVTEYNFGLPDPNAGLYIYPPSGPEQFVATSTDPTQGAGPEGVDIDAAGNIYVANNNGGYAFDSADGIYDTPTADTLHNIQVFSSAANGATPTLQRTISGTFDAIPLVVGADGTIFFSSFSVCGCDPVSDLTGVLSVAAGASSTTTLTATPNDSITLYNGYSEINPSWRHRMSARGIGGMSHTDPAGFRRLILSRKHLARP